MSLRLRALALAGTGSLLLSACVPAVVPTTGPSPSASRGSESSPAMTIGVAGWTWEKAADVARPDSAFTGGSEPTTGPAGAGTAGHPGHFPGQAIVDDVVSTPGSLVAVGYVGVRGVWNAISWQSTDGEAWTLAPIDDGPGTLAVGVAVGEAGSAAAGRLVAGGIAGREPAAWTSTDGRTWQRHAVPTLSDGADAERIGVVVATADGFLAGGSVGPELGERHARLWRSADGASWEPVPDDAAFDGAEVVAIARHGGAFVALGRLGTGQRATGSVAWTSPDGIAWSRVPAPGLAGGLVAALAEAPDGTLVAVGSDLDEREALAWRSTDGGAWNAVPREPSRLYADGRKIRMTDVTATAAGLVAVGNYVGLQYGSATSWRSSDGVAWQRAAAVPALQQGEMLAVARGGRGLVGVGSFGAPDNYIPTIWSSALPAGD